MSLTEFFKELKSGVIEGYGPTAMKELKEQGKHVVGAYCVFTPDEVIAAADAIPVTLCSKSDATIQDAEKHLPRNLCPLIKSSYGFAVTEKCPYFYFADLILGENTCDGKKKMYEYLGQLKPMHVMQLPQTNQTETAYAQWQEEIVLLKERLEREFGVTITPERLREEIKLKNEERQALKEFYGLAKLKPSPLFGSEILYILDLARFTFDKTLAKEEVQLITAKIKDAYTAGERRISELAPRILITGCPLGTATEKIVHIIEECGGSVVCFENCSGAKGIEELVDESGDVYEALSRKYLNTACSCMSPNDKRIELLSRLMDEYQVDGVIDVILQACHTYNVETFRIKQFVNQEKNLPYMSVETDYSQSDVGQLKTRIAAFLEMI